MKALETLSKLVVALQPPPPIGKASSSSASVSVASAAEVMLFIHDFVTCGDVSVAPYAYETAIKRSAKETIDAASFLDFARVMALEDDDEGGSCYDEDAGGLVTLTSLGDKLAATTKVALQSRVIALHLDNFLRSGDERSYDAGKRCCRALSTIKLPSGSDRADVNALCDLFACENEEAIQKARAHLTSEASRLRKAWRVFPLLLKLDAAASTFVASMEADKACEKELMADFSLLAPVAEGSTPAEVRKKISEGAGLMKKHRTLLANASSKFKEKHAPFLRELAERIVAFRVSVRAHHRRNLFEALREFVDGVKAGLSSNDRKGHKKLSGQSFQVFNTAAAKASMELTSHVDLLHHVNDAAIFHEKAEYDFRNELVEVLRHGIAKLMLPPAEAG
ncbi:MAG: hypothetical protein GY772_10265 [bacterium]|nr:hypothetical protein [bacterium]